MEFNQLKRIIEAVLLAAAQPLSLAQIGALFTEEEAVSHEELARVLQSLQEDCAERGVELVEVASGFRYQVRPEVHPWVARMWTERPSRYSRALLETLALIAYRQPITRAEIEQIRGVTVSSNIVKTLEEREWVRVVGYRDVPGKPALFGTTKAFLDYFNLKSLDELPTLAEIRDLDEIEPQLRFDDGGAIPVQVDAGAPDESAAVVDEAEADIDADPRAGDTPTPDTDDAIVVGDTDSEENRA